MGLLADTAKLAVQLDLKGNFASNLKSTQKALGEFDRSVTGTGSRALKAGQQVGTGIRNGAIIAAGAIGLLATQVTAGLNSLVALEKVTTQTNAVLKSTKGVSGQTADSIRALANRYESLNATIDDKVIQSAANVLLTFTAVRKEGFEPALKAALNMSTALGTDLQGSVIQIGKALQDPIKGLTALRRVGVNFSADQIAVIKRLVETGQTLKAQKLIIAELNTEFGGSFLAQGNTTAGKVAKFQDSIEELQKALATALLPTLGKVSDRLSTMLADPRVIQTVKDLGDSIAGLFSDKNLADGGKILGTLFDTAKAAAPVVSEAAKATLGAVRAAVSLFTSLPPDLQRIAISAFAINKLTGGLVTNVGAGIVGAILGKLRSAVVNVSGAVVNVVGAGGVPGAPPPVGGGGKGSFVGGAAKLIGVGVIAELANVISPAITDLGVSINKTIFGSSSGKPGLFGIDLKPSDLEWPFGPKNTPTILADVFGGNGIFGGSAAAASAEAARAAAGFDSRITGPRLGPPTPAGFGNVQGPPTPFGFGAAVPNLLKQILTTLKSNKPADVMKAAKDAVTLLVDRSRGDARTTSTTLAGLKAALRNTHDPKTAAILRSAIDKVQAKLPGREFAARQLAKADAILRSNATGTRKIEDLKTIQRSLLTKGLPAAAASINARIDAAKRDQVYATNATRDAIRRKDLSVRVNVPVTVNNRFSVTDIIGGTRRIKAYGNVYLS